MKNFLFKRGKLQSECKHEKAHWIEEISKDGVLSGILVKRCYICNANIDKLEADAAFMEQVLVQFDNSVEQYKAQLISQDQKSIGELK